MMRSLYSGVSGLRNHQTRMDVVGNNIANVNTVGYKASRTIFQDLYSQNLKTASAPGSTTGGTNPNQVGLGVSLQTIDTLFTTSAAQVTGNTYDLMIQNDGFFVVRNGTQEFYTRAGNFYFDKANYLVTANGNYLMGFQALITEGADAVEAEPSEIEFMFAEAVERTTQRKAISSRTQIDTSGLSSPFADVEITLAVDVAGNITDANDVYDITPAANGKSITIKDRNKTSNSIKVSFDYDIRKIDSADLTGRTIKIDEFGNVDGANSTILNVIPYPIVDDFGKVVYSGSDIVELQGYTLVINEAMGVITGTLTDNSGGGKPTLTLTGSVNSSNVLTLKDSTGTVDNIKITLNYHTSGSLNGYDVTFTGNNGAVDGGSLFGASPNLKVVSGTDSIVPTASFGTITLTDKNNTITASSGWTVTNFDRDALTITIQQDSNPDNEIVVSLSYYSAGCLNGSKIVIDNNNRADSSSSILTAMADDFRTYHIFGDVDEPVSTVYTTADLMEYITIGLPGAKPYATYRIVDDPASDTISIIETDENGISSTPVQVARPRESTNYILNVAAYGLTIELNSNYQAGDLDGFSIEMDGSGVAAVPKGSPISVFGNTYDDMNRIYVDPLLYNVTIDDNGIVSGLAQRDGFITCPKTGQRIAVLADQRVEVGQVVVATFDNQQALEKVGDNLYRVTNNTGIPYYNKSGANGAGTIKPGTLEMSNVDLSQEFTDMIVTQRGFQANSRVITVSDTLLEELINLKR